MEYIIVAIITYLLGSISFSVIFTKKFAGVDVRKKGSGNAGSTNVLRVAGKKPALLTLICDTLKGVIAVGIAILIGLIIKADDNTKAILVQIAGIFVIIGHTYPVFFQFKGGKGVATSLGVLLIINWKIGLICLIFALVIMVVSKIVSLGSIAAAILFPILCIFMGQSFIVQGNTGSYVIFGIILALIVIFNHRANIKKLANGTENKLNFNSNLKSKK
jgi:glycerol-3-phosphate acyltransferase PlsY